jgi:hypothetical protein
MRDGRWTVDDGRLTVRLLGYLKQRGLSSRESG